MTEKEKMVEIISDVIWRYTPLLKYEPTPAPPDVPTVPEAIADALFTAGFRDVERGRIFMNGEAIVPTPDIYNKVAELLGCPLIGCPLTSELLPDKIQVFYDGTIKNDDKHRAEVAELALKNACYNIERSNIRQRYQGVNPLAVERLQRLFIKHAERQLGEETKNG